MSQRERILAYCVNEGAFQIGLWSLTLLALRLHSNIVVCFLSIGVWFYIADQMHREVSDVIFEFWCLDYHEKHKSLEDDRTRRRGPAS